MADTLQFDLVSPERVVMSGPADMVIAPGSEGQFGVLPRHAPMIATLKPGVIEIRRAGQPAERIFVAGGIAEATPAGLTVLTEEAAALGELNRDKLVADLAILREDLGLATEAAEKTRIARRIEVAEAKLALAA